jgi:hypothetical protein
MILFALAQRFYHLPFSRKVAICEAALLLAAAQALIKLAPYRWWAKLLGPVGRPASTAAERPSGEELAGEDLTTVTWAVAAAARRLPWSPVCLPRAMAAKWMLARRNVAGTLHLGIRRGDNAAIADTELHAWLSVGTEVIVGGEIADQFSVIASYGSNT